MARTKKSTVEKMNKKRKRAEDNEEVDEQEVDEQEVAEAVFQAIILVLIAMDTINPL